MIYGLKTPKRIYNQNMVKRLENVFDFAITNDSKIENKKLKK